MKKNLLGLCAILFSLSINAQLKVNSVGKVGIGTNQVPASSLSVNAAGNSNYAAFINGNCKIDNGNIYASLYNPEQTGSNTQSLDWALSQLMNFTVRGYGTEGPTFYPNPTPITYQHFSLRHQDLSTYFPGFTLVDENGNYTINYTELIPVLIYGYQKLLALIEHFHPGVSVQQLLNEVSLTEREDFQEDPLQQTYMIAGQPVDAALYQNTTTPISAQTKIRFRLPDNVNDATICIFDLRGKLLKKIPVSSGMDSVSVNGYELGEGMFLYTLIVNGKEVDTKKIILSK